MRIWAVFHIRTAIAAARSLIKSHVCTLAI